MIKHFAFSVKKHLAIASGIMLFMMPVQMFATTHIVHFGDYFFSPNSFSAQVGDTVTWQGDFSMHNTTSESIPAGAAPWSYGSTSDTTFSYVIKVAGTYHYECTFHVSLGMVGLFTVTAASAVRPTTAAPHGANSISVQALSHSGKLSLQLTLPQAGIVSFKIFNSAGRQVLSLGSLRLKAGANVIPLTALPSGSYHLKLIANEATVTQTLSLLR
jgi:plastocyanin